MSMTLSRTALYFTLACRKTDKVDTTAYSSISCCWPLEMFLMSLVDAVLDDLWPNTFGLTKGYNRHVIMHLIYGLEPTLV